MVRNASQRLFTILTPFLVVGTLQTAGCIRREVPPPPPGGAYISTSGGAQFDQTFRVTDEDGKLIKNLSDHGLSNIHRPVHNPTRLYVIADGTLVYISNDNGQTWQSITQPLNLIAAIVELESGILIISGSNEESDGVVMRSLDNGRSWNKVLTIPAAKKKEGKFFQIIKPPPPPPVFVSSLAIDPWQNDQIYATTSTGDIVVGSESGKVWHKLLAVVGKRDPFTGRSDAPVRKIIPSPHQKDEILIITREGDLIRAQGEERETITVEPAAAVIDAIYIPQFPEAILVGTQLGAVVTTDRGESWTQLTIPTSRTSPITNISVRVSPTNTNRIIVAVDGVVYRSENSGATWNTFSLELPNHIITDLSIDPSNAAHVLLTTTPVKT